MTRPDSRHHDAWHIPTEDGSDYGVLVRCGPPEHPYWWLLCPATATLYLGPDPDLTDCADGAACDFLDDVHARAHKLRRELSDITPLALKGAVGPGCREVLP